MCEDNFCKGQIEFSVVFGLEEVSGYVKIPKTEYSLSDDDFDIYLYVNGKEVEDSDYHGYINPYIEEFIWEYGMFLHDICDNAHKTKTTLQYDEIKLCGEYCDELYLIIDGSEFEWDINEEEY